jgi:Subtilase family
VYEPTIGTTHAEAAMSTSEVPDSPAPQPNPESYDPDLSETPPSHNPDLLLLPGTPRQAEIDAVNTFIDTDCAHTGRLGQSIGTAGQSSILPVTGVDARVLRDSVRTARDEKGARLPDVRLAHRFQRATVYHLMMDRWGHSGPSFEFFRQAPAEMPAQPYWIRPPVARRPVIALLDSGVREHPWLPVLSPPRGADQSSPFVIEQWEPTPPIESPNLSDPHLAMASGHATFIAGLIRMEAPDAQVLSMRVMGADGAVDEINVEEALMKLKEYVLVQRRPIDVVCMAFGRLVQPGDDNQQLDEIKKLLGELAAAGVRLAASAGNDNSNVKVYPAAFGHEVGVESVGALDPDGTKAIYSNHGDWVHHWRVGTRVTSVMPEDGFAKWSGTSFAVGKYAAELAKTAV